MDEAINDTVIILFIFYIQDSAVRKLFFVWINLCACSSSLVFLQCTMEKNVAVSDICLSVYSHWISCKEETTQVKQMLYVCIGATSIRDRVTWNREELEEHAWTCHNVMLATNSLIYNRLMTAKTSKKKWYGSLEWHVIPPPTRGPELYCWPTGV